MGVFNGVPIGETQSQAMEVISTKCEELNDILISFLTRQSCYTSICQTKLEEFALFANKAISRDANFK